MTLSWMKRTGMICGCFWRSRGRADWAQRRMVAFERALGRELFLRKPRGYALTEEGSALLAKVEAIEARVLEMTNTSTAAPLVKISAGTWVTRVLIGKVDAMVGALPVRLRFIAAEDLLDIGRREAVIGIRNRRPEGVGLAGRKIGRVRFAVYATGPEVTRWARVMSNTPSAAWVKAAAGDDLIEVTAPQNALDLAADGTARAVLPTFIGDADPRLRRVSEPIPELDHDQWLVTHNEDRFLPEVRPVIDRIFAVLRDVAQPG